MSDIFLGLGSNLGDRQKYLDDAMQFLEERGVKILKKSSVYEMEAVGYSNQPIDQPKFLNMVVEVLTELSPENLLRVCLDVENNLGRVRRAGEKRFGPRVIDIDVLLYQDKKIQSEFLTIPHPRMYEREFVMKPLDEIRMF